MTPEMFTAVERFLPAGAVVMFAGLGEPLTNPHLPDFVRRLKRRGVSPCVITNGVLMTRFRIDALIDANIDQFQVSVHAADHAAFWRLVPDIDLDRRLGNLSTCSRSDGHRDSASVSTSSPAAVATLARELGFDFFVRTEHNRGGHLGDADVLSPGCGIFAAVTLITNRGDVLPCVNDVAGHSRLGNVRKLQWDEVVDWKRRTIGSGRWFPACASCDDGYRWVLLQEGGLGS